MVWLKKCFLIVCTLGQGACQSDSGAFKTLLGRVEGYIGLINFVSSANELSASGGMGRTSHPLSPPRIDYGITARDMGYFLQHSMLGVCTPKQVEAHTCFCPSKFQSAKVFRNTSLDSQAVVAVDTRNKLIVVSYRLTVSTRNFDTDYDFELVSYPGRDGKEKVHRGDLILFRSIHFQMEPFVVNLLKNPNYKDYKLHLTGYSLGAAVAAISLPAWLDALKQNRIENKVQVYSYSGPRPGNVEYARYLESLRVPIVRYAKIGDGVPLIPDQTLGFSQVGQEFYDSSLLVTKPLQKCRNDLLEDRRCSMKARHFLAINHLTPFQLPLPLPPFC